MKKLIYNILIVVLFVSCKAQSQTFSLAADGIGAIPSAYYKDTNNDFNKFVGTWLYTNGTTSLTIEFKKRVNHYDSNDNIYYDMLVGEYKYIENGVLKANTLANLSNTGLHIFQNTISGTNIMGKNAAPKCSECTATEKRVLLYYTESDRKYLNQMFAIRYYVDELGTPFIKLIHFGHLSLIPDATSPVNPTLPEGTYILEKM